MSDNRDITYAIFAFGFGIWSFFWGFKRLRRKRLVENTPTSTVRGLAMGLVELCGKAEPKTLFKSPLLKEECVLYKYLIEEYRGSGRSGRWVTIAYGDSFYCPFWLNDGTGKIMVRPRGAELILPADYEFSTGIGKKIPEKLIAFMDTNGISYKSWLFTRTLRFKEWFVRPEETVYVMGSARRNEAPNAKNPYTDYKSVLMERIEELKEDSEKMKGVDLNKDGKISMKEWDLAVAKLEREVLEETLKNTPAEDPNDVVIDKGDQEPVFIISDKSEKDLTLKLLQQCLLGVYGGAALTVLMLVYLLFRFGLFG